MWPRLQRCSKCWQESQDFIQRLTTEIAASEYQLAKTDKEDSQRRTFSYPRKDKKRTLMCPLFGVQFKVYTFFIETFLNTRNYSSTTSVVSVEETGFPVKIASIESRNSFPSTAPFLN